MLLVVVLAVVVPTAFLYFIHWLDLYGSDRPRIVLLCFAWGLVAFVLSFATNRFCIDVLGFTRAQVGTRTAPFVEELFKALVLFWLLKRAKLTYFVDGAIYGFASGIGFAVIENLRYIQLFPGNPLAVVVVRDFSSALAHGTATALTGIAIGSLIPSLQGRRGALRGLTCLLAGMALHYVWNIASFYSTLDPRLTEWVLVGVGLAGLGAVAGTILWGLRHERLELHDALGAERGVSQAEARLVQRLEDLDTLLAPIDERFGRAKRLEVATFLRLEARLGVAQERVRAIRDPALRPLLEAELPALEAELDRERRNVGVYVMMYVRSIFPDTQWSLWLRAGEDLRALRPTGFDLWAELASAIAARRGDAGISLPALIEAYRPVGPVAQEHPSMLPRAVQECLHWIRQDVTVTIKQVATRIGQHEHHAATLVEELVVRGLVHRQADPAGDTVFSAADASHAAQGAMSHLWRSVASKLPVHS